MSYVVTLPVAFRAPRTDGRTFVFHVCIPGRARRGYGHVCPSFGVVILRGLVVAKGIKPTRQVLSSNSMFSRQVFTFSLAGLDSCFPPRYWLKTLLSFTKCFLVDKKKKGKSTTNNNNKKKKKRVRGQDKVPTEGYEARLPAGRSGAVGAAGPSSGPAPEDCSCSPPTGRRSGGCAAL